MARKNQRADGRYQKMVTVGRNPDGSYMRKTIYAKTRQELNEKVAKLVNDVSQGVFVADDRTTFAEMAEIWYAHYKPSISWHTKYLYRKDLDNHLLPVLGGYRLKELKPLHLQKIINDLTERGYATWTMKKVKQTAAQVLEAAIANDLLHRNVFTKVKVPRMPASERRALTEDEIALVTRTWEGHRMGIPALIMLYCGLRRGEVLALRWEDIHLDRKTLTVDKSLRFGVNQSEVKTPKTEAGKREVPIPSFLLEILEPQPRTGLVCPRAQSEEHMSDTAWNWAWKSYKHYLNLQAGGRVASRSRPKVQVLDNITAHMLRHTYASTLYNAGVDVKSAQRFLGHASLEMTLGVYTHLSKYKEDASVDALNGYLDKVMSGNG